MYAYADKLYMVLGYLCSDTPDYYYGKDCYSTVIYTLDLTTRVWTTKARPESPSTATEVQQYALWPLHRSYPGYAGEGKYMYMLGGLYVDLMLNEHFMNDLVVFNVETELFEEVVVKGGSFPVMWTATIEVVGSSIYEHSGNTFPDVFHGDVYEFKIGAELKPYNLYVCQGDGCYVAPFTNGSVLHEADAGITNTFYIQTRDAVVGANTTSHHWLPTAITWGADQDINVAISSTTATNTIVKGTVVDMGDGLYKVTHTPTTGAVLLVHVFLGSEEAIGSPFNVTVRPYTADADRSMVYGYGTHKAVKGNVGYDTLVPD